MVLYMWKMRKYIEMNGRDGHAPGLMLIGLAARINSEMKEHDLPVDYLWVHQYLHLTNAWLESLQNDQTLTFMNERSPLLRLHLQPN